MTDLRLVVARIVTEIAESQARARLRKHPG